MLWQAFGKGGGAFWTLPSKALEAEKTDRITSRGRRGRRGREEQKLLPTLKGLDLGAAGGSTDLRASTLEMGGPEFQSGLRHFPAV